MIEAIVGILSSSGLGAAVGALGSYLTKREERERDKVNNEHEFRMAELDLREAAQEQSHALALADKKLELTEAEGEIAHDIGELNAFTQSIMGQLKQTGIQFVDAIRGLMRPIITTYLLVISSYLAYRIGTVVGGIESLPADDMFALYKEIISGVLFLTTVAVTWWFGSRPSGHRN